MNYFQFWKSIFCLGFFRMCFGGDSSSDASTTTQNTTTNNVTSVDRRGVASENADVITGDGNSITRISTDFGSVGRALDAISSTGGRAIDLGQFAVGGAVDVLKQQTTQNLDIIGQVIGLAKNYGANAQTNSRDVMNLATSTAQLAADAYKNNQDTMSGNRTIILAGVAVVGVVGFMAFKKAA